MSDQNMDKKAIWQRKWTIFKEYYLPYVFVAFFFLVLIVGITIFDSISPDEAFMVVSVDVYNTDKTEEYMEDFLESAGIDTEKNSVTCRSFILDEVNQETINAIQSIMAYIAAGQMDIGVMDRSSFTSYAYMGVYTDLRDYLTEEEFAKLEAVEGMVYYIERADLEAAEGIQGEAEDIDLNAFGGKEGMEDPVPVGFNLGLCGGKAYESFVNVNNEAFCGVIKNSVRTELCDQFLDYVINQ